MFDIPGYPLTHGGYGGPSGGGASSGFAPIPGTSAGVASAMGVSSFDAGGGASYEPSGVGTTSSGSCCGGNCGGGCGCDCSSDSGCSCNFDGETDIAGIPGVLGGGMSGSGRGHGASGGATASDPPPGGQEEASSGIIGSTQGTPRIGPISTGSQRNPDGSVSFARELTCGSKAEEDFDFGTPLWVDNEYFAAGQPRAFGHHDRRELMRRAISRRLKVTCVCPAPLLPSSDCKPGSFSWTPSDPSILNPLYFDSGLTGAASGFNIVVGALSVLSGLGAPSDNGTSFGTPGMIGSTDVWRLIPKLKVEMSCGGKCVIGGTGSGGGFSPSGGSTGGSGGGISGAINTIVEIEKKRARRSDAFIKDQNRRLSGDPERPPRVGESFGSMVNNLLGFNLFPD